MENTNLSVKASTLQQNPIENLFLLLHLWRLSSAPPPKKNHRENLCAKSSEVFKVGFDVPSPRLDKTQTHTHEASDEQKNTSLFT